MELVIQLITKMMMVHVNHALIIVQLVVMLILVPPVTLNMVETVKLNVMLVSPTVTIVIVLLLVKHVQISITMTQIILNV